MNELAERKPRNRRYSYPSRARDLRIADRYRSGEPIKAIAVSENVNVKTVTNVACRLQLSRRRPDQKERNMRVVSRYESGELLSEIAADEGMSTQAIRAVAKRAGVPPRRNWQRRYPINEQAFDDPTPVGWWLIGLLAADGCVTERDNQITLAQSSAGVDVLRAFFAYVGCPNRPLSEIKPALGASGSPWTKGRHFAASVQSKHLCEVLALHGIVPRKSQTLRLSTTAASQMAVWLGILDGDGTVGLQLGHGRPRIDFVGTQALMTQCSDFWGAHLTFTTGNPPSIQRHAGGLSRVALHGATAGRAARIMLESSPVSLQRKRRILEQIAAVQPSKFANRTN